MEKFRLRKSARRDSERIEKLVYKHYFELVPKAEGFGDEEEFLCKKIADENGNVIAGCTAYVSGWGCLYVDDLWVDEKYRRRELGSNLLRAVEDIAADRGCYLSFLETGDFQAGPFYLKHGYTVFGTVKYHPAGHEDYAMYKRLDKERAKRPCKPTDYAIADGGEEDGEYLDDKLNEYNLPFLNPRHEYIKINRKLVDEDGNVAAAITAGVSGTDAGWIWKIWVDEKHRGKGLGTLLLKHFEKKAKEKGAVKFIVEEVYDWNVGFFLKNGYKVAGRLPGLPENHSYYIVDKDL
ncbi:MAG: GNAT family N-acetyltransferase [Clostridia bacterium]|jgi:GNAT superfamily N-acetyltransferase|nr:GNAT family N-acetyltransferase [Clostridia bacterium]